MSIHKSQGSEFDEVVVVLPDARSPLSTRELFYTAVTRARARVVVFGDADSVRGAVGRRLHRTSGLPQRMHSA
jgi:exodeoxyribonuclease V alpha subunit